jgi:hypothetical protein
MYGCHMPPAISTLNVALISHENHGDVLKTEIGLWTRD